jgi:hypothetical protein
MPLLEPETRSPPSTSATYVGLQARGVDLIVPARGRTRRHGVRRGSPYGRQPWRPRPAG